MVKLVGNGTKSALAFGEASGRGGVIGCSVRLENARPTEGVEERRWR
jgi:hypothetical protein